MGWMVEKAVEFGVTGEQPLAAQRSVVRLAGDRADKRLAHCQGVVVSASEQCGRNRLADVVPVQDFQRWLPCLPPAPLPLSMGTRVLRTETAGLAALAILAADWGGI